MNSPKSVEYAAEILNRLLINSNLTNIVTSYLMAGSDIKLIKVGSGGYMNLNVIKEVTIYWSDLQVPTLVINKNDPSCSYIINKAMAKKIVTTIDDPDLLKDFYEVFGK